MTTITPAMKIACLLTRISDPTATVLMPTVGGFPIQYFCCTECGFPIYPDDRIEWDHVHATVHEGPNVHENLRPIHYICHKAKTARDVKANAKVKRLANPKPSKRPMKGKTSFLDVPAKIKIRWPKGRKLQNKPFYQKKEK